MTIFASVEKRNKKHSVAGIIWRWFAAAVAAFFVLTILWVCVLARGPIFWTPLMLSRSIEHMGDDSFHTHKIWRSRANISPELAKAVVASEDNCFFTHHGFDWKEIDNALGERRAGTRYRGASTISQQTARNVFLWPSRSWIRKGFETYFTVLIEFIWGKKRILEVYMNVAEMGKGIYGAEAAARYLFGTTAVKLTRSQACTIAACLPNPIKRNAAHPGPYTIARSGQIASLIPKLEYPDWVSGF